MSIIYNTRLSLNLAKNVAHTLDEYDQLPMVGIDESFGDVVISFRGITSCVCHFDSVEAAKDWIKTTSPTTVGKKVMTEWRALKHHIDSGDKPEEKPASESDFSDQMEDMDRKNAEMKERHKLDSENCDYILQRLFKHWDSTDVIPQWKIERFTETTGYVWDDFTVSENMFNNLNEWKDALIELFQEDINGVCTPIEPNKLTSF